MFRRVLVLVVLALALPVGVVLAPPAAGATAQPLLRAGSHGAAVVALQRRLVALRYLDVGTVDGRFGPATQHAVVAFQKVQRLDRDGVVGPRTWAKLAAPYRPSPRYRLAATSVEVILGTQVVYLCRDGVVIGIADASTGSGGTYWQDGYSHRAVTPTGRFRVTGVITGWHLSPLGWMYRPYFFYAGYALHGSTSVPPYPASHGCVRVTVATMDRLAARLRLGTPVAVYR